MRWRAAGASDDRIDGGAALRHLPARRKHRGAALGGGGGALQNGARNNGVRQRLYAAVSAVSISLVAAVGENAADASRKHRRLPAWRMVAAMAADHLAAISISARR